MCTIFCSVSLPRETKQNQTNEGVRDFQWNGMHAEFVWINYRGDFDFGGVNFGNSKSNCKTLRFPLGANIFGVVDDCCALHGMALVALTVIGDRDDILLFVSALVGSLIILTVDWLLLAARGVGVWGGDVHSCIAWLRVRNLPLPLFCVEIWGWSWCQFTKYRTTLGQCSTNFEALLKVWIPLLWLFIQTITSKYCTYSLLARWVVDIVMKLWLLLLWHSKPKVCWNLVWGGNRDLTIFFSLLLSEILCR